MSAAPSPIEIALVGVTGAVLLGAFLMVSTHRYSFLTLLTLPIGWVALVLFSQVSLHLNYVVGHALQDYQWALQGANDFATVFSVKKLKVVDVVLSGCLIMVAFGFSQVVTGIDRLTATVDQTENMRRQHQARVMQGQR
eukprot:TRINITY_DN33086_c0_g1_i1.p2 TRINITY_DN33086_c0_g1~~TRINITY_DN33086_c0_g1_i1.p2  ORF type:complete len:139 (+),score=55.92 TRINITY_DN33086_c0_g1_i1:66-482(+)